MGEGGIGLVTRRCRASRGLRPLFARFREENAALMVPSGSLSPSPSAASRPASARGGGLVARGSSELGGNES